MDGFVVRSAVQTLPFGGRDITAYISRQLRESTGYALDTMADLEVCPFESGREQVLQTSHPDARWFLGGAADEGRALLLRPA